MRNDLKKRKEKGDKRESIRSRETEKERKNERV